MSPKLHQVQMNAADWQINLALVAAVVFAALRLFVAAAIPLGDDADKPWGLFAQLVIELALIAWLAYGMFKKRFWSAVALFSLWAVGYTYNWIASGRLLPPFGLIGLALGLGLFQGLRGTYTYRALAKQSVAPV